MVFDRVQLERTLGRALELDVEATPGFDAGTVRRLADELGISQTAVTRALGETLGPEPGMLNAVAQATIAASPEVVTDSLGSYLRLRGLTTDGSKVWRQEGGWWPDLYRFTASTPVGLAVAESDDGTLVRLTARLDRIWRTHLIAGIIAPVLAALAFFTAVIPSPVTSLAGAVLGAGASVWWYQLRRRAIERRLARALTEIASPAYRLAPW